MINIANGSVLSILTIFLVWNLYLILISDNPETIASDLPSSSPNSLNFSKYQNETFGIKIDYPSEWQQIEDFRGSWFRTVNDSVNVRVESISFPNASLHDLTAEQLKLTGNQFPGQKVLESNVTTIGNNISAHKLVFTFPEAPSDPRKIILKEMQVLATYDSRAFIISYFTTDDAFEYYLPLVKKMIDSFRIIT